MQDQGKSMMVNESYYTPKPPHQTRKTKRGAESLGVHWILTVVKTCKNSKKTNETTRLQQLSPLTSPKTSFTRYSYPSPIPIIAEFRRRIRSGVRKNSCPASSPGERSWSSIFQAIYFIDLHSILGYFVSSLYTCVFLRFFFLFFLGYFVARLRPCLWAKTC